MVTISIRVRVRRAHARGNRLLADADLGSRGRRRADGEHARGGARRRALVELQIPATAAGDLRLPALLKGNDPAALQQLKIVTADIAHNLDVRQNDVTLDPTITVRPGATVRRSRQSCTTPRDPAPAGFRRAERVQLEGRSVRTVARYQPASGDEQIVSVTVPAARVMFDPPLGAVLGQFAIRGLRTLFDAGDQLLFLACLLLPIRRARSLFALIAAVMLGQAVEAVVSVTRPPMSADWIAGAGMVAASTIVIGSVQGVVRARLRWTIPVALTFGVLNGYLLGQTAASTAQFGGGHSHAATFTFGAVILIGELWLGALVWTFRGWLDERGLPEPVYDHRLVLVAHQAMHRIVERADFSSVRAIARRPAGAHPPDARMDWRSCSWPEATPWQAGRSRAGPVSSEARDDDAPRPAGRRRKGRPPRTRRRVRPRRPGHHRGRRVSRAERDHRRKRQ